MVEVAALYHEIAEADALAASLVGCRIALADASIAAQPIGIRSDDVGKRHDLLGR